MSPQGVTFFYIQISILILQTAQNLLQPEYSVRIINTGNLILSPSDFAADDDLEVIKNMPQSPELNEKLNKFHKFVTRIKPVERSKERYFYGRGKLISFRPDSEISYPESPLEIAVDQKHLSMLERRRKASHRGRRIKKLHSFLQQYLDPKKWKIEKREVTTTKEMEVQKEEEEEEEKGDHELEKEYREFVARNRQNNTAFNYTDEGKPEENFKEVVKKIADVKTPENCTNVLGIGVQAIGCVVKNFKNKQVAKRELLIEICIIILFWCCLYLAVALPLWCTKGWCCCCFRCAFCFPYRTVKEIQKYVAENPPGVYVNSDGEEEHYNPTRRETQLYEKLKRSIVDF